MLNSIPRNDADYQNPGIWDASIQGYFITGHSVGGGALFIPLKAAQWCFEAKKAWLTSNENTWITSLTDFLNVIVPYGLISDSETNHLWGLRFTDTYLTRNCHFLFCSQLFLAHSWVKSGIQHNAWDNFTLPVGNRNRDNRRFLWGWLILVEKQ